MARRVPANFKTKIDTLVSRATVLVKKGVPEDQLMAQLKTDDLRLAALGYLATQRSQHAGVGANFL